MLRPHRNRPVPTSGPNHPPTAPQPLFDQLEPRLMLSAGIAWYELSGNAEDSSGNGLTGTFVGDPTPTEDADGQPGGALAFDGSDYVRVQNDSRLSGMSQLYVRVRFKADYWPSWAADNGAAALVSKFNNGDGNNGTDSYWINIQQENGKHLVNGGIYNSSSTPVYPEGAVEDVIPDFDPTDWCDVAMSYDGATVRIHVKRPNETQWIELGAESTSGAVQSTSSPLTIGRMYGGSVHNLYFRGAIDDVFISDQLPAEQPLTAVDDAYAVDEDQTLSVPAPGVLINDTDANGDTLSADLVNGPANAADFHLNADGSFTYTPEADFNGTDSFTYQAYDGQAYSNVATVTIDVLPSHPHALFEQLARGLAYWEPTWEVEAPVHVGDYTFAKAIPGPHGFHALCLESEQYGPAVVFRGTEDWPDWFANFHPEGVGYSQFIGSFGDVNAWIAQEAESPVDLVGHSLGGALAQWFAAKLTSVEHQREIDDLVTFNAPGISKVAADAFQPSLADDVMHYISSGDIISMAGQAFIEGQWTLAKFSEWNPEGKHMRPVLNNKIGDGQGKWGEKASDLPSPEEMPVSTTDKLNESWFGYKGDRDYNNFLFALHMLTLPIPPNPLGSFFWLPLALRRRDTAEAAREAIGQLWYELLQLGDDLSEILALFLRGKAATTCPVDMTVVDPEGRVVSKLQSNIPDAEYVEEDITGDGDVDDIVTIPLPLSGSYEFIITPETYAQPGDTFTLTWEFSGETKVLLADEPVPQVGQSVLEQYEFDPADFVAQPPEITSLTVSSLVDEGAPAEVAGTLSNPSPTDQHWVIADWGDGTVDDILLAAGERSFSLFHEYADDGQYEVGLDIIDDDGDEVTAAPLTVVVDNVAPTLDDATVEIFENSPNGTVVAMLAATDPGADTLTYHIVGGNELSAFAINVDTGQITVADTTQLDYETTPTFALEVEAHDGDGGVGAATVTVNLLNQSGQQVTSGDTATIGFWRNKHGQALIEAVNGGGASTVLGDWLAANFGNMYADLAGATNAEVAEYYRNLFRQKKAKGRGPAKLDAQVMATALACYVTSEDLAGTIAADYGFTVTQRGVSVSTFNVGTSGAAFDVADHTEMAIIDLLRATNDQAAGGVLYGLDSLLRSLANEIYSAINEQGDI